MILNPSTRLSGSISAWITIFVIILHGLTVWAVISMDSPEILEAKAAKPQAIQLELVTLPKSSAAATAERRAENILTKSNSVPQRLPQSEKKSAELSDTKQVEAKSVNAVSEPTFSKPLNSIKPLSSEPKKQPSDPIKNQSNPEKTKITKETQLPVLVQKNTTKESEEIAKKMTEEEQDLVALVQAMTEQVSPESTGMSTQGLVIKETRKTVKIKVKAEEEIDIDIASLIRSVTAQFNRDQARQWQEGRKRAGQELLQAQAGRSNEKRKQLNLNDEAVDFLEEQASWLDQKKPETDLPSAIWREVTSQSGDIFTVLLELHVDKSGYITDVQLLESSGNKIVDIAAMTQVRAGQLKPFQQNERPVNGIVPMSLIYERP
ncbi:TonB family protein [Psychrobacter sp. ANT_H56B]|nr:TonB family protein [Psychrobacter sp. ANT_H56B]